MHTQNTRINLQRKPAMIDDNDDDDDAEDDIDDDEDDDDADDEDYEAAGENATYAAATGLQLRRSCLRKCYVCCRYTH